MKTNRLGSSSVEVTQVGLGTAQLGDLYDELDDRRATAIVDAAWDSGIRYFDTAPHYGVGLAEHRLGAALAARPRDDYVVSSKVGRLLVPDGLGGLVRRWDFSADGIRRSLDESLERLGLDRIDIALIHDPQEHMPEALGSAYPALAKLKEDGVVGAIGVGTGDIRALTSFVFDTDVDVLMIAGRLTLLEQPALDVVVPAAAARGISVLGAGVFNTGLLATARPEAGSRYEYSAASEQLLARAGRLADIVERHGLTLPEAAIRYVLREPTVTSVVLGADSPEQIAANVALVRERRELDALWLALEADGLIPPLPSSPERRPASTPRSRGGS